MRIGIVNDVRVAASVVERIVARSGRHAVAWVACDGGEAVRRCARDRPDLVLMDLVMPGMDGVEATRQIMRQSPCAILLVTASIETNEARIFEALGHGALDVVMTPVMAGVGDGTPAQVLLAKIDALEERLGKGAVAPEADAHRPIVCLGASSGGPKALACILRELPADFPAPVVVVQHLDADAAKGLCAWLATESPLHVGAAETGETPQPGTVRVAASRDHLVLTGDGRLAYTPGPAARCRPSIDVFFRSVASRWKGGGTGVLLTGAGDDGAEGLLALREAGFHTIAQDEATCAVFEMPRAAIARGAACEVLPADRIAAALLAPQRV